MTDHANELRRYARKIAHPAGDVPSVMLAAAEEIERLAARLEATEEDRVRFLVEMGGYVPNATPYACESKRRRKNATPCAPRSSKWSGRSRLRGCTKRGVTPTL